MGNPCSHNAAGYDNAYALGVYQTTLQHPCMLPDVGIDESLLKYSGLNSNAELETYAQQLAKNTPGYIEKVGSSLASLSAVPNAVGLGALVISMVLEIFLKSTEEQPEDTYSILRRVFGEEKASSVRDMMAESLKRYELNMKDDQGLLREIQELERELSARITVLDNSLRKDHQMSNRGFKIWVNGAAFRLQMMIHAARLKLKAGEDVSGDVAKIEIATDQYLRELPVLLDIFKKYRLKNTRFSLWNEPDKHCWIVDTAKAETEECFHGIHHNHESQDRCTGCDIVKHYIDHIFSKYEPITGLVPYFTDLKSNLNALIRQDSQFNLPAAA